MVPVLLLQSDYESSVLVGDCKLRGCTFVLACYAIGKIASRNDRGCPYIDGS